MISIIFVFQDKENVVYHSLDRTRSPIFVQGK